MISLTRNLLCYGEKLFLIFFLLGPLILMLGRAVSDVWLSLIAISFLIYSIYNKNIEILKTDWLKPLFYLIILFIISSLLSNNIWFCLSETFAWLRFPIFALAVQQLLLKEEKYVLWALYFVIFSLIVILFIGFYEIITDLKPRLYGPFNKQIPGTYIAKVCLPAIIILTTFGLNRFYLFNILSLFLVILSTIYVLFTGERMALIILLTAILFTTYFSESKKSKYTFFALFILIIFMFIFVLDVQFERFTSRIIFELFNIEGSGYWTVWFSGINAFIQNPFFGIGPANLAIYCTEIPNVIGYKIGCENHPHNYYIQMLAEVGIFGPLFLFYFYVSLIKNCYINNQLNFFIIPLLLFFPISTSGDFFGQTGNIFTWFSIGIALHISKIKIS